MKLRYIDIFFQISHISQNILTTLWRRVYYLSFRRFQRGPRKRTESCIIILQNMLNLLDVIKRQHMLAPYHTKSFLHGLPVIQNFFRCCISDSISEMKIGLI